MRRRPGKLQAARLLYPRGGISLSLLLRLRSQPGGANLRMGTRPWLPVFLLPNPLLAAQAEPSAPAFKAAARDRIRPQPSGSALPSPGLAPYWQKEKSTRLPIGCRDCSSKAAHGPASSPYPLPSPSELAAWPASPDARRNAAARAARTVASAALALLRPALEEVQVNPSGRGGVLWGQSCENC